jgi:hypothetical protein
MVRPARFGWNPQTDASNKFQQVDPQLKGQAAHFAQLEFDALVVQLRQAGVTVHAADDRSDPVCPDAVFPNNWLSFHADGTVVLYPMLAANRRCERRADLLTDLEHRGYHVARVLDLTHHEADGRFLEGTGSIVFDHARRTAYACLSPRTDAAVLDELCAALRYEPCVFSAADPSATPIYHTNVILSIGTKFAVVALEAIADLDRCRVHERLLATGRTLIAIDQKQVREFAGNILELRGSDGAAVLALSSRALAAFGPDTARLHQCVDRIVAAPMETIERLGGGSVRCMLAEVFLPH